MIQTTTVFFKPLIIHFAIMTGVFIFSYCLETKAIFNYIVLQQESCEAYDTADKFYKFYYLLYLNKRWLNSQ